MSHDYEYDNQMEEFENNPSNTRWKQKRIQIEWTPGYNWWLLPTIEISAAVKEISFEWLCFAIYFWYGTRRKISINSKFTI